MTISTKLFAVTGFLLSTSAFAPTIMADAPGRHPAYLHARTMAKPPLIAEEPEAITKGPVAELRPY